MASNFRANLSVRRLRRAASLLLCAFAGLAAISAVAQSFAPGEIRISSSSYSPPQSTLRVNTKEVQVEVVVRDPKGMPVGGLRQEQFQLFDKGQLRKLTGFVSEVRSVPGPISGYKSKTAPVPDPAHVASAVAPRARFVALFFDDIHTQSGDFRHAQVAALRFLKEAASPGDKVGVFTASARGTLDFTSDKSKLLDTVNALRARPMVEESGAGQCPRITPYQAYLITAHDYTATTAAYQEAIACRNDGTETYTQSAPPRGEPLGIGAPVPESNQTLQVIRAEADQIWNHAKDISEMTLGAIANTLARLSAMPGDRMLLFSSAGFLSEGMEHDVDELIAAAVRSGIVMNALDAKGLYVETPGRPIDEPSTAPTALLSAVLNFEAVTKLEKMQAGEAAMENFAMATGGLLFRNNNDLDYGFYELGVVPAYSYILSFSADDARPDGSFHSLNVKVDRPESQLEYRPGYYAPTSAAAVAKVQTPVGSKLDQAVASKDDLSEIPASASAKPAKSVSGAQELAVTIHVDIRSLPFEKKDDRQLERLDLVVALFDSQNNFVAGKRGEFDLALKSESLTRLESAGINGTLSITAPPGAYRLRAVAQEALTGKTAATSQPIQIQ